MRVAELMEAARLRWFALAGIEDKVMAKSTAGIGPKGDKKVASVMHEWGQGDLHSGSKKGPVVQNQKQAVAIALSQARKVSRAKRGG